MELSRDLAKRIYFHALDYIEASKLIGSRVGDYGHSSVLLSTLGFELLSKCVFFIESKNLARSHDYCSIWHSLTETRRDELIKVAHERHSGHADYSDINAVLEDLKRSFMQGRYEYEVGKELSDAELFDRGQRWADNGWKDSEADFRYRPWERRGLIFALADFIQQELELPKQDVTVG